MDFEDKILDHYNAIWTSYGVAKYFYEGPFVKLGPNFRVLEFAPSPSRDMWIYATSGMSSSANAARIELHIFSYKQDSSLVELLNIVAYYHLNEASLGLNHTVNFGRPWQDSSLCSFGLISRPYLDGPSLEHPTDYKDIRFYWLLPITEEERSHKISFGIDSLEELFESRELNYIDPKRKSVV